MTTTTAAASLAPPPAYDARDVYPGQATCKAFRVLDQGNCNSCYAFASAAAFSARMCRWAPGSVGDIAASPQQLMDCTTGCNGGSELAALDALVRHSDVELWCDPYTQAPQPCGSFCGAGIRYAGVPGSVRSVGGAGPQGVLQMQLELVRGGPGVVSFVVMNDLYSYAGGVYSPSATAVEVGGHAVSLVGWGEENGVPYWICQNSWGEAFGEAGFFRIRRGADTCTIESRSGLTVLTPLAPAACPASACAAGAVTLADCTCRCDNGKTGPDCSVCALACRNGGVRDANCTRCTCPLGFSGPQCEGGYQASPLAVCAGDATPIAVSFVFGPGVVLPPTQSSFIGVYPIAETGPFNYITRAFVCGAAYSGGLCPTSGVLQIPNPGVPGRYKLAVATYSPINAQGLEG
jgi:cathepsin B